MIYEVSKSNWTIMFPIWLHWKLEPNSSIGYYTIDVLNLKLELGLKCYDVENDLKLINR